MNILFIGDIYGQSGVDYLMEKMFFLKEQYKPDLVIANAENVDNGKGLDYKNYSNLALAGVDLITMGNHVWGNPILTQYIDKVDIIRPCNLKDENFGCGYKILQCKNKKILIINALGRVFMPKYKDLLCPFYEVQKILEICLHQYDYSLLDFHAEATSEKIALAYHLDGQIDAILGTHTHVQTNDERMLSHNTLYISDVGMTGPLDGVIGSDKQIIINNFLDIYPKKKQKIAEGKRQLNGVLLHFGTTKKIKKIKLYEK